MYSIEKAEKLSISEIWELYRKYINNSQVDLISSFGFGKDKVKYAEGIYIYTYDNKKILKVRKEFAEKKKMEVHKNYFSPYIVAIKFPVVPSMLNENPLALNSVSVNELY